MQVPEHYPTNSDRDIARRVRAALAPLELEGLILQVHDQTVYLEGSVTSTRDRDTAIKLAREVEGVRNVVDALTIEPPGMEALEEAATLRPLKQVDIELERLETAQDATSPNLMRVLGAQDEEISTDEAEPYSPPTDPVVRVIPRVRGDIDVTGGFSQSSMDNPDYEGDVTVIEGPGDAEIADDVRIALREDAATADLDIFVFVRNGIVHLRGIVPTLDDAEAAEDVASRVPGIVEVRDELDVSDLGGASESEGTAGGAP